LARQGKTKAARAQLAQVYDWFTEGFDTADLSEAKLLLEDLGRGIAGRPSSARE
jgi:adenylate cyclase